MNTIDFLARLGEDANLRARYRANRGSVLAASALDPSQRQAIASGELVRIRAAAGVDSAYLPPKIISVASAFAA